MRNKKQRKIIIRLLIAALILFLGLLTEFVIHRYRTNRTVVFMTEGKTVHIYRDKKWQEFPLNGVNIGLGRQEESGYSTQEDATFTKDEYSQWFKQLAAMEINVIHIYTVLPPVFYKAFFEYNLLTDKPLYLLHGIRVNGNQLALYQNAYDDRLNSDFFEEIRRTIDVIHGKVTAKQKNNHGSGTYNLNISPYVLGYTLQEETDFGFVTATNQKNPHIMGFEGDYLYTENASPYEAWLAAVGNYVISYEQEKYGGPQKLVSWTNSPNTNLEHIRNTEKFNAGFLAALQLQDKFVEYKGH